MRFNSLGWSDVRPTDDVDVIVSITRYPDYANLQEKLRKLGFKHDMHGPNCRFTIDGLTVDVMPSEGEILGFTNSWYGYAMDSATQLRVAGWYHHPADIATNLYRH